ncbi:MAG TPA: hypothetical protein VIM53_04445 [Candidatus Saccharimonadales bacterium]
MSNLPDGAPVPPYDGGYPYLDPDFPGDLPRRDAELPEPYYTIDPEPYEGYDPYAEPPEPDPFPEPVAPAGRHARRVVVRKAPEPDPDQGLGADPSAAPNPYFDPNYRYDPNAAPQAPPAGVDVYALFAAALGNARVNPNPNANPTAPAPADPDAYVMQPQQPLPAAPQLPRRLPQQPQHTPHHDHHAPRSLREGIGHARHNYHRTPDENPKLEIEKTPLRRKIAVRSGMLAVVGAGVTIVGNIVDNSNAETIGFGTVVVASATAVAGLMKILRHPHDRHGIAQTPGAIKDSITESRARRQLRKQGRPPTHAPGGYR